MSVITSFQRLSVSYEIRRSGSRRPFSLLDLESQKQYPIYTAAFIGKLSIALNQVRRIIFFALLIDYHTPTQVHRNNNQPAMGRSARKLETVFMETGIKARTVRCVLVLSWLVAVVA